MATITNIRLKSSAVSGKLPALSDLSLRELAVNTADGKLFIRKGTGISTDSIIDLTNHSTFANLINDDHTQYIHTTTTRTGITAEFNTTGKITTTNYIGIGTTNPQYKLDVLGDINFTGIFYQNGNPFVASRWTAGTGDDIYKLNGNVGIGTTNPTEKLDIIGKIKTDNSVLINDSQIKSTTTIQSASFDQFVADSFSSTTYRTTKYLIQVEQTGVSEFYSSEILLMHDDTNVYITEYAILATTNSPISSIDADINNGNIRLLVTPSVANTTTKISRISLTA